MFDNGIKNDMPGEASTLIMRDGSRITGQFKHGEITGLGVKTWADGRIYQGQFLNGEMHGEGILQYQ